MNTKKFVEDFEGQYSNLQNADIKKEVNHRDTFNMHIMSSDAIINMLVTGGKYLTLKESYVCYGVFKGGTLLPVAHKNKTKTCIGIDNWSKFDEGGNNKTIINGYMDKLDIKNVQLVTSDYQPFFKTFKFPKMGMLFADGDHTYDATLDALNLASPHMSKKSIIIIDDTDRVEVTNAVNEFLKDNNDWSLLWDLPGAKKITDKHMIKGWWAGVMVIAR